VEGAQCHFLANHSQRGTLASSSPTFPNEAQEMKINRVLLAVIFSFLLVTSLFLWIVAAGLTLLRNDSGLADGYFSGWDIGYEVGSVLSPESDQYPFRIDTVYFLLYRFHDAASSAGVRARIHPMANGVPGTTPLASSAPVTITTFFYPHWASIDMSEANVIIPAPESFLVAIEYLDGVTGTIPSTLMDNATNIPAGRNFYSSDSGNSWIEHYDWWSDPTNVGHNMIRVTGQPQYSGTPDPHVPDLSGDWTVVRQYEQMCPRCFSHITERATWFIIQNGNVYTTSTGLTGQIDGDALTLGGVESLTFNETFHFNYYDLRISHPDHDIISGHFFGSTQRPDPCSAPPTPQPVVSCSVLDGSISLTRDIDPTPTSTPTPTPSPPPDGTVTPTPTPTPTSTLTLTPTPSPTPGDSVTPPPFVSTYLGLAANGADGTISVLDVDSGSVVETLIVGSPQGPFSDSPGGIAITPDQSLALVNYARSGSHRVVVLDLNAVADGVPDNEIIATIPLMQTRPGGSNSIAIVPDGSRAYLVGQGNSDDIAVIDISAINDGIDDNEVSWIDGGYAFFDSIAITPDGRRAYITNGGYSDDLLVLDVDPASLTYHTFIATISGISGWDRGIAITSHGDRAYVAESSYDKIYVLDTNPAGPTCNTIVDVIDSDPENSCPEKIAISPGRRRAYVVRSFVANDVAVLDIEPGSPTYHEIIDTIRVGSSPSGIALTSDGQTALVANEYGDSVSILDLANNTEVKRIPVGNEPDGIAVYLAPVPDDHVKVVDEGGAPASGVSIYHNGASIGKTDERGVVIPPAFSVGDTFVALQLLHEQATQREGHATQEETGWAYRTYVTNIDIDSDSVPRGHTVNQMGQQRLTLKRNNSLTLFHLVVSIEWDATVTYTQQISQAVRYASDYLYDLIDGQMAFGHVAIYDNGEHWADADIQISTKNIVRPHAYVGGITSQDTSHVIRVGRGWDGNSGNQGAWDQLEGYRTLGHEFGHYGLYLYDEYFKYVFDENDNVIDEVIAYCTGPENRNAATDATNASVMDYQYTTSELSARGVPGLWSALCEATAQWQLNGESAWETLARKYADTASEPHWSLTTPADRGGVLAGPLGLPSDLLPFPQVTEHNGGPSAPSQQLTVYGPHEPYWGAIVALYKQNGRVIGQGFTDKNGRLDIYGADEGDIVRAASFDGGLAGSVTVTTEMTITLILEPVGGLTAQVVDAPPHMRVVAEPSQDPNQIDLLVFLQNFGPGADPSVVVTEPGSEVGHAPTLSYSPAIGTYEGQISFSATERGMGRIRAVGAVGGSLVRLQSTYRLQRIVNEQSHDVYSDDGNLSLYLEPGSLPGSDAYIVVMPPGAVPGPLPDRLVLVGDSYDVTASGAMVELEKSVVLKLHYDGALINQSSVPEGLGIYRWDPNSEMWQVVPGSLDEEQKAVVTTVMTLGTYALMAPPGPWVDVIFLPLILKGSS
jgi:YVTN family beta-propeller protein